MANMTRTAATPIYPFLKSNPKNHQYNNCDNYLLFRNYAPLLSPHQLKPFSLSTSWLSSRLNCGGRDDVWDDDNDNASLSTATAAYSVLGVEAHCSTAQLKAAFRAKVGHFHHFLYLYN